MRALRESARLLLFWLVAGMDAAGVEAHLWLALCGQRSAFDNLLALYSMHHWLAFPASSLLMLAMSLRFVAGWRGAGRGMNGFIPIAIMWASMYPACLLGETLAAWLPAAVGSRLYAFLMLAIGSGFMHGAMIKNITLNRGWT